MRGIVRELAFTNPLLDFDQILFVKRAPTMFPHLSDQYYGWWARPGGGAYVLENFGDGEGTVRCLTDSWPIGNFLSPDISYDASKALVAFSQYDAGIADERNKREKANVPEGVFYHLFEIDLATGHKRKLTRGKYDDVDGRYLPSGDIVFLSTVQRTVPAIHAGQFTADTRGGFARQLCPLRRRRLPTGPCVHVARYDRRRWKNVAGVGVRDL